MNEQGYAPTEEEMEYEEKIARLQAINHDLLEALENILEEVSGTYGGWAKDALSVTYIQNSARAAIAKARGDA